VPDLASLLTIRFDRGQLSGYVRAGSLLHVLYVTICSPWCITFGGGIRNAGLLRGLARRHRVEVALLTDELTSPPPHPPLGTERIHVFPVRDPYVARAWISHPANRLAVRRRWLDLVRRSRPDAVWYFSKSAVHVVDFPPATPVVVDLDNVDWWRMVRAAVWERGTKRLRTRLRAALSRAEGRWLSRRADITVLANADEIPLVRQTEALRAIPNGADFATPPSGEPRTTKRLLHLGSLRYPPNLDGLRWFCRAVWPRVLAAVPDTWLDLAIERARR